MDSAMPAYKIQIEKAVMRKDVVSINHRVTEFLASYFDLLFAVNEKTHPGEKRLMELCKKYCSVLPDHFEENIRILLSHLYADDEEQKKVPDDIHRMIECIKAIII